MPVINFFNRLKSGNVWRKLKALAEAQGMNHNEPRDPLLRLLPFIYFPPKAAGNVSTS
jgi:hypothetical protein